MKKFLPLLFILLSLQSFSQTNFRFADSTAQWNVLSTSYNIIGQKVLQTEILKVTSDTLIQGYPYQKVESTFFPLYSYYLRRDSLNRIFVRRPGASDCLLYDFSVVPGDTIRYLEYDAIAAVIDSVDSVYIDHYRKRIYVRYSYDTTSFQVGTCYPRIWVDGIGTLDDHFLWPGGGAHLADYPPYTLLCFFENGQLLYHDSLYQECEIDTTISVGIKYIQEQIVQISPNPTTSFITIQSENSFPEQTSFQLFDVTGRMILQKQITDKSTRIDLNEVSKGMYLYHLSASGQKISSGKIVEE